MIRRPWVLLVWLAATGWWSRTVSASSAPVRWTVAPPDAMVALTTRAAVRQSSTAALARLVLLHHLHERASAGRARDALRRLGRGGSDLAQAARWLYRSLLPAPRLPWHPGDALAHDERQAPAGPAGLLRSFAVLGPFRDSGGGLDRAEGPERPEHDFFHADYSWGAYRVRPTRSVVTMVDARGLPLALYLAPRRESCSYLSTAIRVTGEAPLHLWVAASGSLRVLWDGRSVAKDEAVFARALLDRLHLRVRAHPGWHLLTVKDCTGARPDSGRVRVRITDDAGRDVTPRTSSAARRLQAVAKAVRAAPPQAEVQRLPTPLETILQVPADSSRRLPDPTLLEPIAASFADDVDRVLAAAVVRSLGGADDLRAAAAPGLVDRVTRGHTRTADQLALAGDLARTAANRSGWLGAALDLAREGGDTKTSLWAQRALVGAHLQAGQRDLAYATARSTALRGQTDADARWLRARTVSSLGGSGLRARALRQLLAVSRDEGERTPAVVWRSIAALSGRQRPALHLRALERLAALSAGVTSPALVSSYGMRGAAAVERAARQVMLTQRSARGVIGIAKALYRAGRYRTALAGFSLAAALSPNLADAHAGVARLTALLDPAPAGRRRTRAALKRAVELQPDNATLAAELAFQQGQVAGGSTPGDDAGYLVAPEVFLSRARARPMPAHGVLSRQLHWRRVVRLHPDGRVSQLIHYAREIGIAPRTEAERYEKLPVGRGAELLVARVHRRDGTEAKPEEQDDSAPMVRWPKLQRGDVVEVAVRDWTPGPIGRRGDPPYYFIDYVGALDTHPVLHNEVIIDRPVGKPFYFDVLGGKPDERQATTRAGRSITKLVWRNPPTVPDEPLSPPISELLPIVVGSQYPSWDAFVDWYRGAVEGFTAPDDQIRRLARELTARAHTRDEKVKALFEFVADDIRYVNYRSGEWWLPNRPQQLLARRQGDCDDKAMLLISLLGAVNIEGREVLVQTRHTRRRAVMSSTRVAAPMFDHGIVYLPADGKHPGRYLDATSPQSRLGPLPAMDSGAMVLRLDAAHGNRVVQTPNATADAHGVDAHFKLVLDAAGGGTLAADERHSGDAAFRLRTHLSQADARAQWIEQALVGRWLSSATVAPEVSFDGGLEGGQARVRYRARSGAMARREGHDLLLTLAPQVPITATLAPLPERTLPVELPVAVAPTQQALTVDVEAPPSHRFAALPPDVAAGGGAFGHASLKLTRSVDGRRLHLVRSVSLQRYRISVAEYPAWRRWLQQIDRMMQRSVRLVPRGPRQH